MGHCNGQSWTLRVNYSPRPVPCPGLHLASSHRAWSLLHWSVKATESVRGTGGQTEVRQTAAIWESTVSCVPALPHHCLPCLRIKGPIFSFSSPGIFTLEFTVSVMAFCSHERAEKNNINRASFSFCLPFLLSPPVRENSCSNIYKEKNTSN